MPFHLITGCSALADLMTESFLKQINVTNDKILRGHDLLFLLFLFLFYSSLIYFTTVWLARCNQLQLQMKHGLHSEPKINCCVVYLGDTHPNTE